MTIQTINWEPVTDKIWADVEKNLEALTVPLRITGAGNSNIRQDLMLITLDTEYINSFYKFCYKDLYENDKNFSESQKLFNQYFQNLKIENLSTVGDVVYTSSNRKFVRIWKDDDYAPFIKSFMTNLLITYNNANFYFTSCDYFTDRSAAMNIKFFAVINKKDLSIWYDFIINYEKFNQKNQKIQEHFNKQKLSWNLINVTEEVQECFINDIDFFAKGETWFKQQKLPYKRGYLFYGTPGNGKTFAIRILLSVYNLNSISFDFGDPNLTNESFKDTFKQANRQAPCVIVIATANNPKSLDSAILQRPGRFDRIIEFPAPDLERRAEFLKYLLKKTEVDEETIQTVAKETDNASMAYLKSMFEFAGASSFTRAKDQKINTIKNIKIQNEDLLSALKWYQKQFGKTYKSGDKKTGFNV